MNALFSLMLRADGGFDAAWSLDAVFACSVLPGVFLEDAVAPGLPECFVFVTAFPVEAVDFLFAAGVEVAAAVCAGPLSAQIRQHIMANRRKVFR